MSAVADKLDEARALIEKGWCQNSSAKGKSGRWVDERGKYAVSFCMLGAYERAGGSHGDRGWLVLCKVADGSPISWNDKIERTQAEVIDAFKRAAELARSEQA